MALRLPFWFKSVLYRRYVDDIFVLCSSPDHADKFKEYLPSKHPNITFSIEKEEGGCLPFLDVNFFHENEKFAARVLYLKHVKLVWLSHYHFGVPVCALILSNFIVRLINWKVSTLSIVSTLPKKDLVIALPYLGKLSLQIRTRINRIIKNKLPYCNIRFVSKCKISKFFYI